jgi:DNA-3-methyladenine glycosylase
LSGLPATLGQDFYDRPVNDVARELIGCTLEYDGVGGVIVETEAYDTTDPACHAFNGLTARNEPLFGPPGRAYVYLSYGIHQLLNFVCEPEGSAAAVLVRALEPVTGLDEMRARRRGLPDRDLCSGPGKLTEALGIGQAQNRADLTQPPFAVLRPGSSPPEIHAGARIGITKGTELPWRYCALGSPFLSLPPRAVEAG